SKEVVPKTQALFRTFRSERVFDIATNRIISGTINSELLYEFSQNKARHKLCDASGCRDFHDVNPVNIGIEEDNSCDWAIATGKLPVGATCEETYFSVVKGKEQTSLTKLMKTSGTGGSKRFFVYNQVTTEGPLIEIISEVTGNMTPMKAIVKVQSKGKTSYHYCKKFSFGM
ncbi:hypothetical protein KJ865_00635, partial [Myxococcota bacterium]|nr:hypothetical protein [Myxococcota bacterium]